MPVRRSRSSARLAGVVRRLRTNLGSDRKPSTYTLNERTKEGHAIINSLAQVERAQNLRSLLELPRKRR